MRLTLVTSAESKRRRKLEGDVVLSREQMKESSGTVIAQIKTWLPHEGQELVWVYSNAAFYMSARTGLTQTANVHCINIRNKNNSFNSIKSRHKSSFTRLQRHIILRAH